MSFSELSGTQLASSSPFQSAQQPADQHYAEEEDVDLDSGSDDPPHGGTPSPLAHQGESNPVNISAAEVFSPEEDLEDSQDSTTLPSRPNKFRGPSSTWRNRNAAAIDLAVSLDRLQAKDLSIHLYNAFKLSQRNRIRRTKRHNQSLHNTDEADEGSTWVPPKNWTAWPLPPAIVPREHDETHWDETTVSREPGHFRPRRPGQYLQEMLVAQVLRKAKEQFLARQWENVTPAATSTTSQVQKSRGRRTLSKGRSDAKKLDEIPDQKPVIMADDLQASEILQPTVQHMMTKLDGLLMGLHHARSAYLLAEDSDSESQSQMSERSRSRGRPRKRKRGASKSNEDGEASPDAPSHPGSDSDDRGPSRKRSRRPRNQTFHDRKRVLGLRDWGDVVGIASMTGWPQNVVANATARCATLFEEGIRFRTLEEGKKIQEEHVYLPNASSLASDVHRLSETWRARDSSSNRFDGAMVGGVHVDGFLKPIQGKKSWVYSNNKKSKRRQSLRNSGGGE